MNYRDFKKEITKKDSEKKKKAIDNKRKAEAENVKKLLEESMMNTREKCSDYFAKAKAAYASGDKATCQTYVDLMKNAMNSISVSRKLLLQLTAVLDVMEIQGLNKAAYETIDRVAKDVVKTNKKIYRKASSETFMEAIYTNTQAAQKLDEVLNMNGSAMSVGANEFSTDEDVYKLIKSNNDAHDIRLESSLSQLEKEFLGESYSSTLSDDKSVKTNRKTDAEKLSENLSDISRGTGKLTRDGGSEINDEKMQSALKSDSLNGAKSNVSATNKKVFADNRDENTFDDNDISAIKNEATEGGNGQGGHEKNSPRRVNVEGAALRPQRLEDFRGQEKAVAALRTPIDKAKLTGETLPHILLSASYGQGKTTLAKIIANEVGGNFIEVVAGVKYRDLQRILSEVKTGDIIFIDEIHKLKADIIEQVLYPAIEDFELHYIESNSLKTQVRKKKINPFTLIGATTETGNLLKPFYSKFKINITLEEYSIETIKNIILNSFDHLGVRISDDLAFGIAKRSRLTPRQANAFVEGISSKVIVKAAKAQGINKPGALADPDAVKKLNAEVTESDVADYFDMMRIDALGLKEEERKIVKLVAVDYKGGPIGIESIAKALNISENRVADEFEPYLIKLGLLIVRPSGRFATEAAYKYLGISDDGADKSNQTMDKKPARDNADVNETTEYVCEEALEDDCLREFVCEKGEYNEKICGRLMKLFSADGKSIDDELDELFVDINKEYDSSAINKCVLKFGSRDIYCDSKLERRFLTYLLKNGFIKDVKAEALEICYDSSEMSGKRYFPDFCMKLHDDTIAVVEMKNLLSIGYHLNVDKYEALKRYCNEKGYRYAQVAKDYDENVYISAEQIADRETNIDLKNYIVSKIDENGICTFTDLQEYGFEPKDLVNILLLDRTLKNIDRTGSKPQIVFS